MWRNQASLIRDRDFKYGLREVREEEIEILRDRQTDKQTDRQTDRQTGRRTDRRDSSQKKEKLLNTLIASLKAFW